MASRLVDVRTRIEEISSAISRQTEILRDLETQRSAAQGELNAILDPMARLPLEISSKIFAQCSPMPPKYDALQAPTIFLSVCRAWRYIALATPSLWAAISDQGIPVAKFPKFFESWLRRARSSPLSLSLSGSLDPQYDVDPPNPVPAAVWAFVKQYMRQVQNLRLCLSSAGELQQIVFSYTSLRSLTVENSNASEYFSQNADECVALLCAAPNLLECNFLGMEYRHGNPAPTKLTHCYLRHLALGKSQAEEPDSQFSAFNCTTVILKSLTLPALESLIISFFDIAPADFISFLTRSSPPLQSLHIWLAHAPIMVEANIVEGYLRVLPSLTELDFGNTPTSTLPLLLRTIADLLPNLCNLTIRGHTDGDSVDCEGVLDAFTPRHACLRSFQLLLATFGSERREKIRDDITVALRQRVNNGMGLHIETQELHDIFAIDVDM
ncbi:hypothetical protein DFH07DRAFT_144870 [Mycena maculata]|uniref:F-box domain-containing protein n=1 Tax=Mycena maculata TaxID=230809 RepID=A0AAD7I033_9AGAR|nr:hypothetical protein DFH07DRAFT_144870 [Mycena maculata]